MRSGFGRVSSLRRSRASARCRCQAGDALPDESVVLDAGAYGDDSLLVLFKGDQPEFTEVQSLTVTGTVRQFSYDDYADDYGLAESALSEVYANEEIVTGTHQPRRSHGHARRG